MQFLEISVIFFQISTIFLSTKYKHFWWSIKFTNMYLEAKRSHTRIQCSLAPKLKQAKSQKFGGCLSPEFAFLAVFTLIFKKCSTLMSILVNNINWIRYLSGFLYYRLKEKAQFCSINFRVIEGRLLIIFGTLILAKSF